VFIGKTIYLYVMWTLVTAVRQRQVLFLRLDAYGKTQEIINGR